VDDHRDRIGCWNGNSPGGALEDAVHILGGAARLVVSAGDGTPRLAAAAPPSWRRQTIARSIAALSGDGGAR
jgi:hypothetical protein